MSFLERWRSLGLYRTLPFFFAFGATVEWFMINVKVGKETFYDTIVRLEAEKRFGDKGQSGSTGTTPRE